MGFEICARGLGPALLLRAQGWVPVWGPAALLRLGGCSSVTPMFWVRVASWGHLFHCIWGFLG